MTQTLRVRLCHILPVSLCALLSHLPAISGHDKNTSIPHKSNSANGNKSVAIAHVVEPGSDAVVDGEAHRVTNDDAGGDHVAAQLRV